MDLLQVKKDQIVDASGRAVRLRGVCVGGWMNMENFLNGYPGAEHGLRSVAAEVLGASRAQFLFERWLDYFLAEDDIAFIAACGANVVRLALNYRHFERDDEPFEYSEAGFARLDRAVQWCAHHGLYVILDLHAAPGWQNPDWHSDNDTGHALFWSQPHYQERASALWQEFARRYRGNHVIAGYDLLNEPMTAERGGPYRWDAINRIYRRLVDDIRRIDPEHIIFLEGDGFASRFEGLTEPFAENLVYAGHSYSPACSGPGSYPGMIDGRYWDRELIVASHGRHQGIRYMREHGVPFWLGEFGVTCNGPEEERAGRLQALDDQIAVFEDLGIHWTSWTYKDLGVMGWVQLDPESEYRQRIAPILDAKARLDTDAWMSWLPASQARETLCELARLVGAMIPDPDLDPALVRHLLGRAAMSGCAADLMQPAFAGCFAGLSEVEIDRAMQSFAFRNCHPDEGLLGVIKKRISS